MDESSTATVAPHTSPPERPAGRPVSMKPAAIVLGLAVLVLLVFAGGAALFRATPAKPASQRSVTVRGTSLRAVDARGALGPIISPGQPPNNVLNAVVVPAGARRVSTIDYSGNASQYDQAVVLSVGGPQAAVVDFYKKEMRRAGWHIESTGPADHQPGIEVLGQLAGDDGWFWELGTVVAPSTFGASGTGTDRTRFTLRLIQEPDAS
jgi:hypothetical protein